MPGLRTVRLIEIALRCYPARWRRRHGDEAAELATLLIGDGTPAGSIALNYLFGAARERLTPRPGRHLRFAVGRLSGRISRAVCALLVVACSLGVSAGLLASTVPARAASTSRVSERAHCLPLSVGPVRYEISATDQPQLRGREAGKSGHGRSC